MECSRQAFACTFSSRFLPISPQVKCTGNVALAGGCVALHQPSGLDFSDVSPGLLWVTDSIFAENSAGAFGAGLLVDQPGNLVVENTHFRNNTCIVGGCGAYITSVDQALFSKQCHFISNTASNVAGDQSTGGGLFITTVAANRVVDTFAD